MASVEHVPLVDLEAPARPDVERALEGLGRAERRGEAAAFRDPLETNEIEVLALLGTIGGRTSAPLR